MNRFLKHTILGAAFCWALCGCTKDAHFDSDSGNEIKVSAVAHTTKAMLSPSTFLTEGNRIRVYDFVSSATDPHINDVIGPEINGNKNGNDAVWCFAGGSYQWTADTHKFFGWLETDANPNPDLTASGFLFDTETMVLTIPEKVMDASAAQFDFMYSNIITRDMTAANPDYSVVELEFSHLFTAFSIAAKNLSTANDITITSVTLSGLKNKNSATIDFSNSSPVVDLNEGVNSGNFVFEPNKELSTNFIDLSNNENVDIDPDKKQFYLMWPIAASDAKNATIEIKYTLNDESTENTKTINLPETAWQAGKKNNLNLIFKDKEISLQCIVNDWIPQEEEIDFSDQVSVRDLLDWDESSVMSINENTGEVILYDDIDNIATCSFHIETPKGATWTASLIPVEGHQDAFKLVESSKYGAVGVDSQIRLVVTNQAPIAPRHVCILRITVQTSDGRTIVVRNLVPDGKSYTEYKIVQNLING